MKRIAITLACIAILASGCGSSDSSGNPDEQPGSEPTSSASAAAADPATHAGACEILVGKEHAVDDAMTFPKAKETAADATFREEVQQQLFSVVTANNKELADSAGQLVDFLDDPEEYIEDGKPVAIITQAVSKIRSTCKSE
jgi:hypothetical protein